MNAPILIVEDDEASAELERRALARAGRATRIVQRVSEALELLASEAFSLVLLDYQLPDGDPWSVVEIAQARVPRVPVIVVTAAGNERIAAEALHHGVAEYLQKGEAFWNELPQLVERVVQNAQAEERARRNDALFRLFAESATDLIATVDLSGVIQDVSTACRDMLGFEREALIGRAFLEFVHEDDRERLTRAFPRATHLRLTYRQLRRDGSARWVEANASVVRDPSSGRAREIVAIVRDVHERKRAEDKFRALLEGSPEANVIVDRHGAIVLVNARAEQLFGYPRSELLGQPFESLVAERYRVPGSMPAGAHNGPLEIGARRKDGSEFPCEISLNRLETEDELLVSRTILDISDRKTLQDQHMLLRLGEQLPRFDDVPSLVHHVATELAGYFDVARCTFAEIDTERSLSIVHGEYRQSGPSHLGVHPLSAFAPAIRHELAAGRVVSIFDTASDLRTVELYATRYQPIRIRALAGVPLMRKGRWAAGFFVTAEDVRHWAAREIQMLQALVERTWLWIEHVRMVRALRASERKYRQFIESTNEGVWEVDPETHTRFVNPRMTDLLGYSADEMLGKKLADFMDERERESVPHYLERGKAGVCEARDARFRHKDGSELWLRLETSPLTSDSGEFVGALAMVADITERRRAEQELERRVEERTRELLAALKEKEVLLKEIHHRVKNNLQMISSMLNLQAMHIQDPAVHSVFAESQSRVQSIALVHETLYESANLASVNFGEYVQALVTNLMQAQARPERQITTHVEADGVLLPVGSAITCGLIINELVTNSLKHAFGSREAGTIRIQLRNRAASSIELIVADDGVGLPSGVEPRRVTTLGLDLVYTFAEQLGAEVEIQRNDGTEFRFAFQSRPD